MWDPQRDAGILTYCLLLPQALCPSP
jgi:hypothetical protein